MRSGTWGYTIDARCSLDEAVSLLSEVERLGELHPLIVSVKPVPPVDGALRSYKVTDRLQWGPVRFRITYEADVLSVTPGEIRTAARQKPRTTLQSTARLSQGGDVVRIDVQVTMQAPSLLFPYAYRTGKAAHLELAQRIKSVLERDRTSA